MNNYRIFISWNGRRAVGVTGLVQKAEGAGEKKSIAQICLLQAIKEESIYSLVREVAIMEF